MNGTPRGLNRFLLSLIGLILLAAGAGLIVLVAVPSAATWWQNYAHNQVAWLRDYAEHSRLILTSQSWVWFGVAALLLVIVIVMISWISSQGNGRANTLLDISGTADDDGAAGAVRLSCAVAEQALKSALLERTDVFGVSVTSYDFRQQTALKVRVLPRQGVSPHLLAHEIAELVVALDELLGFEVPVVLSIGSAARSRFTKAERVR
ncbi:hypothetical protein [Arthrobacter glacialis]|uniref:Alkaline shock response membrane anchor protein AmaP n=1 Tax=Arthrobacter glacialis TaxID=1664 RepID=A0A2S3ZXR2_ARTGL|nr:hypothetical protein [Arthrobacter glacialis]POH59262.1 hypothetical protein CVS28_07195 [Arthrobacter glacialis]POH73973.1 hypothetical protein CVS27_08695 [Arthrobacter glacialis]